MAWTADDLLSDVQRSAMLPSSTSAGTADTDILAQADKEMQTRLMPLIIGVREDFYVATADSQAIAGTDKYRLPKRNMGGRLRDVLWLSSGTGINAPIDSLARLEPEDVWKFASNRAQGNPVGFFMESGSVVLVPAPASATGVLRLKYFTRPGRLAKSGTTTARQITAIAADTPAPGQTRITIGAHSILVTQTVDLIRNSSPFEYSSLDLALQAVAANTLDVLTSALPSDFGAGYIGDWISLADTSPVMQLPVELHGVLAQRTVARMLKSLGFLDEAAQAEKDAVATEREAIRLLTPRVEGEARKVVGQMFWRKRVWPGWGR